MAGVCDGLLCGPRPFQTLSHASRGTGHSMHAVQNYLYHSPSLHFHNFLHQTLKYCCAADRLLAFPSVINIDIDHNNNNQSINTPSPTTLTTHGSLQVRRDPRLRQHTLLPRQRLSRRRPRRNTRTIQIANQPEHERTIPIANLHNVADNQLQLATPPIDQDPSSRILSEEDAIVEEKALKQRPTDEPQQYRRPRQHTCETSLRNPIMSPL